MTKSLRRNKTKRRISKSLRRNKTKRRISKSLRRNKRNSRSIKNRKVVNHGGAWGFGDPKTSAATETNAATGFRGLTSAASELASGLISRDWSSAGRRMGNYVSDNPGKSALAAAAVGASIYGAHRLLKDTIGTINAKEFMRLNETLLPIAHDYDKRLINLKESYDKSIIELKKVYDENLLDIKTTFAREVSRTDPEAMLWNPNWRNRFTEKVAYEVGLEKAVTDETMKTALGDKGSGIPNTEMYNKVIEADNSRVIIQDIITKIFGNTQADAALGPNGFEGYLLNNDLMPNVVLPLVPGGPQPVHPKWHFTAPPRALRLGKFQTQAKFDADPVSQALYELYKSRWVAWSEFQMDNIGTPVSKDFNGNDNGGVPKPAPPGWMAALKANADHTQKLLVARQVGAPPALLDIAKEAADLRVQWVFR